MLLVTKPCAAKIACCPCRYITQAEFSKLSDYMTNRLTLEKVCTVAQQGLTSLHGQSIIVNKQLLQLHKELHLAAQEKA